MSHLNAELFINEEEESSSINENQIEDPSLYKEQEEVFTEVSQPKVEEEEDDEDDEDDEEEILLEKNLSTINEITEGDAEEVDEPEEIEDVDDLDGEDEDDYEEDFEDDPKMQNNSEPELTLNNTSSSINTSVGTPNMTASSNLNDKSPPSSLGSIPSSSSSSTTSSNIPVASSSSIEKPEINKLSSLDIKPIENNMKRSSSLITENSALPKNQASRNIPQSYIYSQTQTSNLPIRSTRATRESTRNSNSDYNNFKKILAPPHILTRKWTQEDHSIGPFVIKKWKPNKPDPTIELQRHKPKVVEQRRGRRRTDGR